jgi:hypothetical protein
MDRRFLPTLDSPPARPYIANVFSHAQVAQSVEQRTENPRVGGSIPPLGTNLFNDLAGVFMLQGL